MLGRNKLARNLQVSHSTFKFLQVNHLVQETCKFLQVNHSVSTRDCTEARNLNLFANICKNNALFYKVCKSVYENCKLYCIMLYNSLMCILLVFNLTTKSPSHSIENDQPFYCRQSSTGTNSGDSLQAFANLAL